MARMMRFERRGSAERDAMPAAAIVSACWIGLVIHWPATLRTPRSARSASEYRFSLPGMVAASTRAMCSATSTSEGAIS